jgi:hypothetical protein
VPHLRGVAVGLDIVEGILPVDGDGGDLGGEAAVLFPAVWDSFGVLEGVRSGG